MAERAPILVHGATGFTGSLVCEALAERGLPFAIAGRSRARLEATARRVEASGSAPGELVEIDVERPETLRDAVRGRAIVLACAGPFVEVGEPVAAACAERGVHYVDTTGEQGFVATLVERYHHVAERTGACLAPAMAYEVAPADWVSALAAQRLGGAPDAIDVIYANVTKDGGYGGATTRGTKKSMLSMASSRASLQFEGGELRASPAGERARTFALPDGQRVVGASFPSPEAVLVPRHTGAQSVCTYMAVPPVAARLLRLVRHAVPPLVRALRPVLEPLVERSQIGPEGEARDARFTILAEARRGEERARVAVTGRDPYGLTAAIQVLAASRALSGGISARGVVGASVALPAAGAIAALASSGLALVDPA